jgi:hypothetical protein
MSSGTYRQFLDTIGGRLRSTHLELTTLHKLLRVDAKELDWRSDDKMTAEESREWGRLSSAISECLKLIDDAAPESLYPHK